MKTLIATAVLILFSFNAYAIRAQTVKGNKALLDLEGESVSVGDFLLATSPEGKKIGILQVKQVKNGKAIAEVAKGTVRPDSTFGPYSPKGKSASSSAAASGGSTSHRSSRDRKAWGVEAGYLMSNMTVKVSSGSVGLSGSSFDVLGFYQMDLDKNISVKASAIYETLNVTGSSQTITGSNGTHDFTVDFKYLGLDALVRYSFNRGSSMEWWGGLGLGFLFAMSKSSNILDTSKVTTNNTINGAIGVDWYLNRTNFVPIEFMYAMFPDNSTSSASQMILRAGYGWSF